MGQQKKGGSFCPFLPCVIYPTHFIVLLLLLQILQYLPSLLLHLFGRVPQSSMVVLVVRAGGPDAILGRNLLPFL